MSDRLILQKQEICSPNEVHFLWFACLQNLLFDSSPGPPGVLAVMWSVRRWDSFWFVDDPGTKRWDVILVCDVSAQRERTSMRVH
jgi:hypothetical protein